MAQAQPVTPEPETAFSSSVRSHARSSAIHRALLTGLLGTIGSRITERKGKDAGEYAGPRGLRFFVAPGSALYRKSAPWVMAAEIVQTTRFFARTVAKTHPDWIEKAAAHLVQRSYHEPHWLKESGQVAAYEKVTLQGLVLIPRRRVAFGPIDPKAAREIFIQNALVDAEIRTQGAFLRRNLALVEELGRLEARARRRDLQPDPSLLYAFYDARIPGHVHSTPAFEKFRRSAERTNPDFLAITLQDVMAEFAATMTGDRYPDTIDLGGVVVPITYRFEPGNPEDGVTATIPVEVLPQVSPRRAEWLIPGYLNEKVIAMLRALPKRFRAALMPLNEVAETCLRMISPDQGSLRESLVSAIQRSRGLTIPIGEWELTSLPPYLQLHIRVIDASGRAIASGRNLEALQRGLHREARETFRTAAVADRTPAAEEASIHASWDFGDLPERIRLERAGVAYWAYPTIEDRTSGVVIGHADSMGAALAITHAGLRRLFALEMKGELEHLADYFPNLERMTLQYASLGPAAELLAAIRDLIAERAFLNFEGAVRTHAEFNQRLSAGWNRLWLAAEEVRELVEAIITTHHQVALALAEQPAPAHEATFRDVREHLAALAPPRFLTAIPFVWLRHLPRYLQAMLIRLRKLSGGGLARDRRLAAELIPHLARYQARLAELGVDAAHHPRLTHYRWMLEEYRVSLFAQELRTVQPVSADRLDELWAAIDAA
jgi:ATP-dependent helicase HrpA